MKCFWKEFVYVAALGIFVPQLIVGLAVKHPQTVDLTFETQQIQMNTEIAQIMMPILTNDGDIEQIALEEYLVGVVLGELPSEFELETKKAQAVVARTYALRRYMDSSKHPQNAVCTDPSCCQAFLSVEEYLNGGGRQEAVDSAAKGVKETMGKVLYYNGELIEATYFSCSGGRTEDAKDVWGADIAYLQAVDSPGEEKATHYSDTVYYGFSEFAEIMNIKNVSNPASWFGPVSYTEGGGVERMEIEGVAYSGTQLRSMLGLRSTDFVLIVEEKRIRIDTHGFGHRVGMSQYGADAMAVEGYDYSQILAHYYPGTILTDWIDKGYNLG